MNLDYAVERLYEVGWMPPGRENGGAELETLGDGRKVPSVAAVKREFSRAGLEISIKQNLMFGCYRATWSPKANVMECAVGEQHQQGTVIGASEREAAVYALAQLIAAQAERQMATV